MIFELIKMIKSKSKKTSPKQKSFGPKDRPVTSKTLSSKHEYEDGVPYTGDEIHFTDGTIWSCLLYSSLIILPEEDCVVFIPMSFKNWLDDEFVRHFYFVDEVKPLLKDALKGGAKIVRGVGLAKDN